ncbi:hypothetical protein JKF63_01071 [Porcisia hertigi]|uniref:Uncharacterized protein n=1 Tax=Porcisia hertigi TaxID=2761500 RepID=A0A836IDQ3_9TRYP|nr:hypothetical protein JKF63_01071 [Porcisia hertigi]
MARKKASKKAASSVAAVSHDRPLNAGPGEPVNFQLAVVNSCLCNEDVRLPRLPTPALLSPFYTQYDSTASLRTSPWERDYWCTKVAHVVLGRHSALPAVYRLRHECAGRLHVRIVYVRAASVHRQLHKAYPPLFRSPMDAIMTSESGSDDDVVVVEPTTRGDRAVADAADPSSPTVFTVPYYLLINHSENPVFVDQDRVPQGRSVALREGDVLSFLECAFDADGGVLDKVECTDVGGCTEGKYGCTSVNAEAEGCAAGAVEHIQRLAKESLWRCVDALQQSSLTALADHEVRVANRAVAIRRFYQVPHVIQEYMRWWHRHTTQLLERHRVKDTHAVSPPAEPRGADFSWMVSGNHLVRAPSIANSDLTSVMPAYTKTEDDSDPSAATAVPSSVTLFPSAQHSDSYSPCVSFHVPQERFSEDVLHAPPVVMALRQWLRDTEGLEEVTDDVHSPLAARLVLDRAWLWRLVRRHQQQGTSRSLAPSPAAHDTLSPSPVKLEHKTTSAGLVCPGTVKTQDGRNPASGPLLHVKSSSLQSAPTDMEEHFRITLPNGFDDPATTGGSASQTLTGTPPRRESVVRAMLEELRRSRSKEKGHATGQGTQDLLPSSFGKEQNGNTKIARTAPGVHRRLCLDTNPICVYAKSNTCTATRPVSGERPQSSLNNLFSPPMSVGMPSCVPAVRVRPAALPVYVFTRRSPSPDVYTRERTSFTYSHSSSPTMMGHVRGSGAAGSTSNPSAVKQFVYYYDPDDRPSNEATEVLGRHQRKSTDGGTTINPSPALVEPSSPTPTTVMPLPRDSHIDSSTADDGLLWVDEAEGAEETPRSAMARKRRPAKKSTAKRKRDSSEKRHLSASEAKAARADGTSVPGDEPPPTRTAMTMQ